MAASVRGHNPRDDGGWLRRGSGRAPRHAWNPRASLGITRRASSTISNDNGRSTGFRRRPWRLSAELSRSSPGEPRDFRSAAGAVGPAVAGAAILFEAGRTVPVQRALTFALAVPILGVALMEGVVRVGRSSVGRAGPVLLARAAAAVLGLLALALVVLSVAHTHEGLDVEARPDSNERLAQFQAVARYIGGRPACARGGGRAGRVQATSGADFGSVPMLRRLRAELEPDLILDVTPYLGDPTPSLQGRPTLRPEVPGFDETSLGAVGTGPPPALARSARHRVRPFNVSFDRLVQDHPSWRVTDWLAIVRGPPPSSELVQPSDPIAPTLMSLIGTGLFLLVGVGIVGIGWAWGTGPSDPIARACLAPATGVSVLVLSGLAAEHLGFQTGEWGTTLAIVVAVVGIIAAAARHFIDRRGRDEEPVTRAEDAL